MFIEPPDQMRLLHLARTSIVDSLHSGRRLPAPDSDVDGEWSAQLAAPGACFVTLSIHGALRGCIGNIEPRRALANDVWYNAQSSAFEDPRFKALRADEVANVALEISVLSPLEPLEVTSEQALLAALRPGVDGLLLSCGTRRATFLPAVWHKIPDPKTFLTHLKRKMGVADDFWDDAMQIRRYAAQEFDAMLQQAGQAPNSGHERP